MPPPPLALPGERSGIGLQSDKLAIGKVPMKAIQLKKRHQVIEAQDWVAPKECRAQSRFFLRQPKWG